MPIDYTKADPFENAIGVWLPAEPSELREDQCKRALEALNADKAREVAFVIDLAAYPRFVSLAIATRVGDTPTNAAEHHRHRWKARSRPPGLEKHRFPDTKIVD